MNLNLHLGILNRRDLGPLSLKQYTIIQYFFLPKSRHNDYPSQDIMISRIKCPNNFVTTTKNYYMYGLFLETLKIKFNLQFTERLVLSAT